MKHILSWNQHSVKIRGIIWQVLAYPMPAHNSEETEASPTALWFRIMESHIISHSAK